MPKDNTTHLKKAWVSNWNWLLNTKWAWLTSAIGGGLMGGVFVGDTLISRLLAGFFGVFLFVVLLVGISIIIHIILTPSLIRKEQRTQYIESNASYVNKIIGNPKRRKYQNVLKTLESMIKIENDITDNIAGKSKATNEQLSRIQKKLSSETDIPVLSQSKATQLYISGKIQKTVARTICKLELQIMGEKPTENQMEFFIKLREILVPSKK